MSDLAPSLLDEQSLRSELESLRQSLLPFYLIGLPIIGWLWYFRVVIGLWDLSWNSVPVITLSLCAYAAFRLRHAHYDLACWLVIAALYISHTSLLIGHPHSLAIAFGVVVILSAHALLGTPEAVLVFLIECVTYWSLRHYAPGWSQVTMSLLIESIILMAFSLAISLVQAHPLNRAVEWALTSWEHTREALGEIRKRRGELYRAVRALDEATFRIQRMNNELIIARREAEVARVIKSRFAATVSHELRSPLNLILGFSAMMVQKPERYSRPLPSDYAEDMETIYRNSQHLSALVDDVLDLSQIEAEQLPLVKDQVDLESDVIIRAVETVRPMAERKGLSIRTIFQGDLPWVLVDAVRIRQVLINLLNNAVRFTTQGDITVSTSLGEDHILVSVQDTGAGIASHNIPRLFQEFHQLHLTEGQEEGSGLGLSISKHLVELHGGRIDVKSEPGQGTAFSFTVPLPGRLAMGEEYDLEQIANQSRATTVRTCLVVHPDPFVVRLMGRLLGEFHIVGIADEMQAREAIGLLHPRAVIAGVQCAHRLLTWLTTMPFDLPIIGCFEDESTSQDTTNVIGHLVKPITEETLRLAIRHLEQYEQAKVLVVDDDPAAVRLLERMLTALPRSYELYHAYNGLQAIEMMERIQPQIVFVDLMMPELTGEEVIARMRQDERLANTKVIIVSAVDREQSNYTLGQQISFYAKQSFDLHSAADAIQCFLERTMPHYLPRTMPPEQP